MSTPRDPDAILGAWLDEIFPSTREPAPELGAAAVAVSSRPVESGART